MEDLTPFITISDQAFGTIMWELPSELAEKLGDYPPEEQKLYKEIFKEIVLRFFFALMSSLAAGSPQKRAENLNMMQACFLQVTKGALSQ